MASPAKKKSSKSPAYLTGFCHNNWHEGPAPLQDGEGNPLPRCKGLIESEVGHRKTEMICGCTCHKEITAMYETAGLPREWPESIWTPDEMKRRVELGLAYDPSILAACIETSRRKAVLDLGESAKEAVPVLAERIEQEEVKTLDGVLPPNPHVEDPSLRDAGYRPKGQLNFDVKIACDAFYLGAHPQIEVLNTSQIAALIDPKMPPSTGAITNVLRKWEKYGFAVIEERPLRFVTYTKAAFEVGYDALERSHKADASNTAKEETRLRAQKRTAALRNGVRA